MRKLQFESAFSRMRHKLVGPMVFALSAAIWACGGTAKENEGGEKTSERSKPTPDTDPSRSSDNAKSAQTKIIGGAHFLSIHSQSFAGAELDKKNLVGQLCRAAAVLDDLSYAVQGDGVVLLRGMLLGIQQAHKYIPVQLREKINPYTATFWVAHGPDDPWTKQRIKPSFIPGELAAAAHTAMEKGYPLGVGQQNRGDLGSNRLEQLEAMLEVVRPLIFGQMQPEPLSREARDKTNATPQPRASDTAEPAAKKEQSASSRRRDYLDRMAAKITPARALCDAADRRVLEHALRAAADGSSAALRDYQEDVAQAAPEVALWLECFDAKGDTSKDCYRGLGALVGIRDKAAETIFDRVEEGAATIEAGLPFEKKWKKDAFASMDVRAPVYQAVCGAGPLGAALPTELNEARTFVALGDGDARLSNLGEAIVREGGGLDARRVLLGEASADLWRKCAATNAALRLAVERIHAPRSGAMDRWKKGSPERYLKEHASVWEALRSRLIGAVVAGGPLAGQLLPGVEPACTQEVYDDLLVRPILDAVSHPDAESKDALRADRIIVNWLFSQSLVESVEGRLKMSSLEAVANGVAGLLSDVQKIRSLGNYREAQSFLNKYDIALSDELMARARGVQILIKGRLVTVYPLLERSSGSGKDKDITQRVMTDFLSRERKSEFGKEAY